MAQPTRGGEPLVLDGGQLGVLEFAWQGDRYHHQWRFDAGESASLVSVESSNESAWPASPPLQQIHQQSFADGRRVVFGVGMAGRGHWSASYTLIPDLHCWIVELACRSPHEPEQLSSSYQLNGQWEARDSGALAGTCGERQLELQPIAPGSTASLETLDGQATPGWVIRPSALAGGTATHQWAFRVKVS